MWGIIFLNFLNENPAQGCGVSWHSGNTEVRREGLFQMINSRFHGRLSWHCKPSNTPHRRANARFFLENRVNSSDLEVSPSTSNVYSNEEWSDSSFAHQCLIPSFSYLSSVTRGSPERVKNIVGKRQSPNYHRDTRT